MENTNEKIRVKKNEKVCLLPRCNKTDHSTCIQEWLNNRSNKIINIYHKKQEELGREPSNIRNYIKKNKVCPIMNCGMNDHTECVLEFIRRKNEKCNKYYHDHISKTKFKCECGSEVISSNKKNHFKTEKHLLYEDYKKMLTINSENDGNSQNNKYP